jgi:hypothetical protein
MAHYSPSSSGYNQPGKHNLKMPCDERKNEAGPIGKGSFSPVIKDLINGKKENH